MPNRNEDVCPEPDLAPELGTKPFAPPIFPASVYACESTAQAESLLGGELDGYVYQRDRHPNAEMLAEKCRKLHQADRAMVAASGMSAMAIALLSQVAAGDHLVVSRCLYGQSLRLLTQEAARLGIDCTLVDACDLVAIRDAFTERTRLVVVETIANPTLRVANLAALADAAHANGALLLVDNTFATPIVCRPLELGADLVLESMSKMMNGHSDVMLGLLCGNDACWERVPVVASAWGLASSPFDCWLASRGIMTLHLRMAKANANAAHIAEFLAECPQVQRVEYPGLPSHPDHELAKQQFSEGFGSMVTFHLQGGRAAADRLIAAGSIPFCPSLGEVSTTLSHPESTSHRGLSARERETLGIHGGTIRLSVGVESANSIVDALKSSLAAT